MCHSELFPRLVSSCCSDTARQYYLCKRKELCRRKEAKKKLRPFNLCNDFMMGKTCGFTTCFLPNRPKRGLAAPAPPHKKRETAAPPATPYRPAADRTPAPDSRGYGQYRPDSGKAPPLRSLRPSTAWPLMKFVTVKSSRLLQHTVRNDTLPQVGRGEDDSNF